MKRISDVLLERYHLGECTDDEVRRVEEALGSDADLPERLNRLGRSDFAFRSSHPADDILPAIRKRAGAVPSRGTRMGIVAALAIAILTPLALLMNGGTERIKGASGPDLLVYSSSDPENPLENGSAARAGDTVQLAYLPGRNRYGTIVSLDGRGSVTLHFPSDPVDPASRLAGQRTVLPTAYRLDDAPDYELFIFTSSRSPIGSALVMRKVKGLAGLSASAAATAAVQLFPSCETVLFLLKKE